MATYTPTTNPKPTKGQSGETVKALQKALNAQNAGKPGYVPLNVDGKYGPLTEAATKFGITTNTANTATKPYTPPTTLSSKNKKDKIPEMNSKLNNLSQKGNQVDNGGNQRYADGSLVPVPEYGSVNPDGSINAYDPNTGLSTKPKEKKKQPIQEEKPIVADTSAEDNYSNRLLDMMKNSLDSNTQSQINNIQQKFELRRQQQEEVNRRNQKANETSLMMGGVTGQGSSAQYAPISSQGIIQAQESYGISQIAALDAEEQDLIASAKQAQVNGDYKIMESRLALVEKKRDEKIQAAAELNKQVAQRNKEIAEANLKRQEEEEKIAKEQEIQTAISDVYSSGITDPSEAFKEIKKLGINATIKEVADNIAILSGVGGSGIVGEYNFYRSEARKAGQVPVDFNTYQNLDANRKEKVARAGAAQYGGYDSQQSKAIDAINTSISNNPAYKKMTTMITFADNINAAISQGSGIGDIAAINQFQKVIDEGAVTRDQDVKLIQQSQSLANSLQQKVKKLQKGDQLSSSQRQEILKLTQEMLDNQKKALAKDPALVAQKKKAARFQVNEDETILGEIGSNAIQPPYVNLIQQETDAETSVTNYVKKNKKVKDTVRNMLNDGIPYVTIKQTLNIQ